MTLALIAALILTVGGHLWLFDRKDKRAHIERADLLQRIQAPEQAIAEFSSTSPIDGPLYRNLGDRDEIPDELVAD